MGLYATTLLYQMAAKQGSPPAKKCVESDYRECSDWDLSSCQAVARSALTDLSVDAHPS